MFVPPDRDQTLPLPYVPGDHGEGAANSSTPEGGTGAAGPGVSGCFQGTPVRHLVAPADGNNPTLPSATG
jgi:hypothetical protein